LLVLLALYATLVCWSCFYPKPWLLLALCQLAMGVVEGSLSQGCLWVLTLSPVLDPLGMIGGC